MNLILTDDPIIARAISGRMPRFVIRCTFGCLEDFPKSELGIDIKHHFRAKLKVIRAKRPMVADLRRLCNKASLVFIATAQGMAGEYLGWSMSKALKINLLKLCRVPFTNVHDFCITCEHVACSSLRQPFNMKLVEAFKARLVCDRLLRFQLSPLVSRYIKSQASVGFRHWAAFKCLLANEKISPSGVHFKIQLQFANGLYSSLERSFPTREEGLALMRRIGRSTFKVCADTGLIKHKTLPLTSYSLLQHAQETSLFGQETCHILDAVGRLRRFGLISRSTIGENGEKEVWTANLGQKYFRGDVPEIDKILYELISKNTSCIDRDDCYTRDLTLNVDGIEIQGHVLLSRSLDSDNPFLKTSISEDNIVLTSLEAIQSDGDTRSAYEIANMNCKAGCDDSCFRFDNLDVMYFDQFFERVPTVKLTACWEGGTFSKVTNSPGQTNIKLSPVGRSAAKFVEKHFAHLLTLKFQNDLQQKLDNVKIGTADSNHVASYLQNSIHPAIVRLKRGSVRDLPRAVRHPRILGNHPQSNDVIKVVKAKYGPCLVMGDDASCIWLKISKIQYESLNLECAIPLLERRQQNAISLLEHRQQDIT